LGFVEAMDLVNKKNGGLPGVFQTIAGRSQHAAHVGHVGLHSAQALELAAGLTGDNLREGSFAGAGRAVENEGLNSIGLDGAT